MIGQQVASKTQPLAETLLVSCVFWATEFTKAVKSGSIHRERVSPDTVTNLRWLNDPTLNQLIKDI
ncbi:MAG: hypothetical protein O3B01_28295 [Planctomycetota bacterium]|nr:hypothetical protein [Planctomycetota bacterium]